MRCYKIHCESSYSAINRPLCLLLLLFILILCGYTTYIVSVSHYSLRYGGKSNVNLSRDAVDTYSVILYFTPLYDVDQRTICLYLLRLNLENM